MSVPYPRMPKYLSPSSLASFEYDPIRFYFDRCGPLEFRPASYKQTEPMAAGCVFDSLVKYWLRHQLGCEMPVDFFESTVDPYHRKDPSLAIWEGLRALRAYRSSPAPRMLMRDGMRVIETQVKPMVVKDHGLDLPGVPIWGKPDAHGYDDEGQVMLFDWKLTGAVRGEGKIAPGYTRLWEHDGYGWRDRGPHHRCMENLESLNEKWATQVAMYGWMMGIQPGTPFRVGMEQIVLTGGPTELLAISIAQFRCRIGAPFQRALLTRLHKAWQMIQNRRLMPETLSYEDLQVMALTM